MEYKVKKGLNQTLKIQGMKLKYFYAWLISSAAAGFFVLLMLMQATRPSSSVTFVHFIVALIVAALLVLIFKVLLVQLSGKKKMNFPKQTAVLSGVGIMKALK